MCQDSSSSGSEARWDEERPTLPPIRVLFREELSQPIRPSYVPTNLPSPSMSRLRISDDESTDNQQSAGSLSGRGSPPLLSSSTTPRPPAIMPSTLPEFNSPAHSSSRSLPSQALDSSREFSGQLPHRGRASSNSEYSIHYDISRTPPREASSSKTGSAYDSSDRPSSRRRNSQSDTPAEVPTAAPVAPKYECSYCGKGFNRPSSLKIHLNSHTGEKPFICPVEGCGRSFSVLSNMRRHARVHTHTPRVDREGSSEDASDGPSPSLTGSSGSPMTPANPRTPASADFLMPSGSHTRRSSNASSTSSHPRSRSPSPDDDTRPEKRIRHSRD
ncbi:hypothetical protein PLICRDRAFT_172934 [Plicaturopsis crispa FD-325 SS-3]|nr:hypothetical protein PLICRDRAFT_172934 [Plicaturopsis crispa FD-325 SS-3]